MIAHSMGSARKQSAFGHRAEYGAKVMTHLSVWNPELCSFDIVRAASGQAARP
jgi:hypothetical protein